MTVTSHTREPAGRATADPPIGCRSWGGLFNPNTEPHPAPAFTRDTQKRSLGNRTQRLSQWRQKLHLARWLLHRAWHEAQLRVHHALPHLFHASAKLLQSVSEPGTRGAKTSFASYEKANSKATGTFAPAAGTSSFTEPLKLFFSFK